LPVLGAKNRTELDLQTLPAAKKASEEDADGLEPEILLAEGACIMITRNLWTAKG